MLNSVPQPDAYLRILPTHGGQSGDGKKYSAGAPELALNAGLATEDRRQFSARLAAIR